VTSPRDECFANWSQIKLAANLLFLEPNNSAAHASLLSQLHDRQPSPSKPRLKKFKENSREKESKCSIPRIGNSTHQNLPFSRSAFSCLLVIIRGCSQIDNSPSLPKSFPITSRNTSSLMKYRIALLLILSTALAIPAVGEETWEKMADGISGRQAPFDGVGGVKIAGFVRKPAGEGPFPLVIILHGGAPAAHAVKDDAGPSRDEKIAQEVVRAGNSMGHAVHPPIKEFLAQGWAVYSIDYRPIPRYTLDSMEWDDTVIAIKQARAFPFVDPKRMAILGGSHGGHVTGRMIAREKFACAVLCAPAGLDLIELSEAAEKGTAIGANQRLVREFEQRAKAKMPDVKKDPAAFQYTSLLTEANKVQCPVLMISGRNDPNAPVAVMDTYMEKLRSLGKEVEIFHPDDGPHGFYFGIPKTIPATGESTQHAVAFIKRHFEAVQR
jgi:dipeptidyl aminopeptidase/acylaminoacyl peptidase